jgi:hypothetical protein
MASLDEMLAQLDGGGQQFELSEPPPRALPRLNKVLNLGKTPAPTRVQSAPTPLEGQKISLDFAQAEKLATLLQQSEVADISLTAISRTNNLFKGFLLTLGAMLGLLTFALNSLSLGIDPATISYATTGLALASGVAAASREAFCSTTAVINTALAVEFRQLSTKLVESLHHSVPQSFKSAQACVDQLTGAFSALSVKLGTLDKLDPKILASATERQLKIAGSREGRRQSLPIKQPHSIEFV